MAALIAPILAVTMLGVALWPTAEKGQPAVVNPLTRETKAHTYSPPRDWYARKVAESLADIPLYGRLLGFEIIQSIEAGPLALVEIEIPQHSDSALIWSAMLADGGTMVQTIMAWYPDLAGIYVWCGFELAASECDDGCGHLTPVYLTYVDASQTAIDWPFPGAVLINAYSWRDHNLFKLNMGGAK